MKASAHEGRNVIPRAVRHPIGPAALWAGAVLSLALAGPATGQGEGQKTRHLAFEARLVPPDPFSEANRAEALAPMPAVQPGTTFHIDIAGQALGGWYTYPLTRRAPEQVQAGLATVKVEGEHVQLIPPMTESETEWKVEPGLPPFLVHKKPFVWGLELYLKPTAPADRPAEVTIKIHAQVCKDRCVWEDHVLRVAVPVAGAQALPSEALRQRLEAKLPEPSVIPVPPSLLKDTPGKGASTQPPSGNSPSPGGAAPAPQGLWSSVLIALGGGFISLLTPCVFPMIPITVSYFLKQSETKKGSALLMAGVYSGTIVLVLAAGGMLLMQVLYRISVHWATNLVIGVLFLYFALSLLGMYEIMLPSWLSGATSSREDRGGLLGVFFMALTFSIISFACVGPIYGGFITLKATEGSTAGAYLQQFLSVLAFSVAFASPFFVLALFPQLLKTMPRAGSWMNAVKVTMGFLELAAVVKFLRAAELTYFGKSELLTFDLALGIYVALSAACGLYLLGVYRLPHDHEPMESVGVPRLMFSLMFLSLGLYLAPGLLKGEDGRGQRPRGDVFAWVESFLLPDAAPKSSGGAGDRARGGELAWMSKLPEALEEAKKQNKLVFLDLTGIACTNCRLNEQNVFTRPEVRQALSRHVLVQLYTDYVPAGVEQVPNVEGTRQMSDQRFRSASVPLYALLRPTGGDFEIVWVDEQGLIRDVDRFVREISR